MLAKEESQIHLTITDLAGNKVREIMEQQGVENAYLRLFVQGGGCAGVAFGLGLDKEEKDGDVIVDIKQDFKIIIDKNSKPYTDGAVIDWVDTGVKSGFSVDNPNQAGGGCSAGGCAGCG